MEDIHMAKKPYVTEGNVIRVSTDLDLEPTDAQITVHLENLNAHYGREKMKTFLKEFYFNPKFDQVKRPTKKLVNE
jgi:hypothetical protein